VADSIRSGQVASRLDLCNGIICLLFGFIAAAENQLALVNFDGFIFVHVEKGRSTDELDGSLWAKDCWGFQRS
jgi:hypothetical protein